MGTGAGAGAVGMSRAAGYSHATGQALGIASSGVRGSGPPAAGRATPALRLGGGLRRSEAAALPTGRVARRDAVR
jgi:hypothetical protein